MVSQCSSMRRRYLLASIAAIGVSLLVSGCAGRPLTGAAVGSDPSPEPICSRSASEPVNSSSPAAISTKAPTEAQVDQVRRWVACAVLANGDTEPYRGGTAVLSTRRTAVQYLFADEAVDSDVPVIAVEVPGRFDGSGFDHPPQAGPITGNMLIVVYSLADGTGDVRLLTDDEQAPDLSALGPTATF